MSDRRIPSLDGFRAIAIAAVIAAHFSQRYDFISPRLSTSLSVVALIGVKIFFVLSGFLITSLLLREVEATGTISLRGFYWRRTLRIFPAMYVFLAAMGLAYLGGFVPIGNDTPARFMCAVTYTSDYCQLWGWPLHHTWSLSVEEQFYLLWPPVLLFCFARSHLRPAFPLLMLALAAVSRAIAPNDYRFDSVCDSLAIGCLAAIYRVPLQNALRRIWPGRPPVTLLVLMPLILFPLANVDSRHKLFSAIIGIPLINVLIGASLLAAIMSPPAWLNSRLFVLTGRLSYSLYLWHFPWVHDRRDGIFWLPATLLCAWASYRFIEQPVLKWRDRPRSQLTLSAVKRAIKPVLTP